MANLTVFKADGTTSIVYDALNASGGESSPAIWRQDTGAAAGLPVGLRATFRVVSKWNGSKTARQLRFQYAYPYAVQDSTTTLYSSTDRVVFDGIITVPQGIPSTAINEGCAQVLNLLATTLVKASAQAGYAPT